MAAPPSKPSPSSQAVEASSKAAPENPADSDVKKDGASAADQTTTATTESESAKKAPGAPPSYESSEKSDNYVFSKAFLNNGDFEQALTTIEEGIELTKKALLSTNEADNEEVASLHESMAPFHYLYGTTLLYSIEESSEGQAVTLAGSGASNEEDADAAQEVADDMEIAWENLETARTILENMLTCSDSDKLKLDLAQVYLREGDLQRMNGRYDAAVSDYSSCLKYLEGNSMLGPYDRKIADVHYNLGLVYMLQVAETKSPQDDPGQASEIEKKLAFLRSRGFHHSFMCGKTLCGQIAFLCNLDPDAFLQKAENDIPKFKSTGEEEDDDVDHPKITSLKLDSLRKHVAQLAPPNEHKDVFRDLSELLIEIQETIDEAKSSEQGVHNVKSMKEQISAAVAGGDAVACGGGSEAVASDTIGFGSAIAAAATDTAQPIMAVKKKKKRDAEDAKMSADSSASKRANAGD